MHKRGYREEVHKAALRETTASGLLQLANWHPDNGVLCDPMCGSGTIPVEAALLEASTAPGLLRYGPVDEGNHHPPPPRSVFWPGVTDDDWNDVWYRAQ
eukprot:gene24722-31665_t